jgi:hypothetical protein
MSAGRGSGDPSFDRVRRRDPVVSDGGGVPQAGRSTDREGKRALYSDVAAPPSVGAVALTCSRCEQRSVVSWMRAARLAVPGVVVPIPGSGTRSWMRCPACRRYTWMDVSLRA